MVLTNLAGVRINQEKPVMRETFDFKPILRQHLISFIKAAKSGLSSTLAIIYVSIVRLKCG